MLKFGERGWPCQTLLLIFISPVNVASSFTFILFSDIFIIAVSEKLGIFLFSKMVSPKHL